MFQANRIPQTRASDRSAAPAWQARARASARASLGYFWRRSLMQHHALDLAANPEARHLLLGPVPCVAVYNQLIGLTVIPQHVAALVGRELDHDDASLAGLFVPHRHGVFPSLVGEHGGHHLAPIIGAARTAL